MKLLSTLSRTFKCLAAVAAICGVSLLALPFAASAQTPAMGQQVPLTPEIVGNFVGAYPVVKMRLDDYSDEFDTAESDSPADAMAAYMTYQQATGELDAMVGEYGFENFMSWVQTTTSVVTAYTFVREGGGMDEQMQQAIASIEANDNFTADQKQSMIDQMTAAMQSIDTMRPDQASLDAVEPYTAELAIIFDDD